MGPEATSIHMHQGLWLLEEPLLLRKSHGAGEEVAESDVHAGAAYKLADDGVGLQIRCDGGLLRVAMDSPMEQQYDLSNVSV